MGWQDDVNRWLNEWKATAEQQCRVWVLLKHERELSDGYELYTGGWKEAVEKLLEIAREMDA